ncbi:MAG: two-component system response regulator GlrR [Salinisphaeraceae bacterium]|nr:two-component system response regulator GlrR [Salinisphaeraceae bacterium]
MAVFRAGPRRAARSAANLSAGLSTGSRVLARSRGEILIVDDDPALRRLLSMRLEGEGYRLRVAEEGEKALAEIAQRRPDLVISDLRMEPMGGMALLHRLQELHPGLPVLLMTAYGTIPDAVEATRSGAYGFITKPVDKTELLERIDEVLSMHKRPRSREKEMDSSDSDVITRNTEMRELLAEASMVAGAEASVLVQGESGTGKEVLARYIHAHSKRSDRPFVAVNCGAIPEDLLESELFGHVKGAFTGANRDHTGLFRSADGGTVFLDEIGDMPASLQVKLLRALEDRKVRPVGSTEEISIDVRVVSATHQNLAEAIENGGFREDLYYRLNVVGLRLPPLRDRREDIPLLASHFLKSLSARNDQPQKSYSPEAMTLLVSGDWPGNVRQLQNVVESNVALSPGRLISLRQTEKAMGSMKRSMRSYSEARADFSREYLSKLLHICEGNVSRAARLAKRNRTDLYKLLSRHNLDPADFK